MGHYFLDIQEKGLKGEFTKNLSFNLSIPRRLKKGPEAILHKGFKVQRFGYLYVRKKCKHFMRNVFTYIAKSLNISCAKCLHNAQEAYLFCAQSVYI